jgi:hypothetical protein
MLKSLNHDDSWAEVRSGGRVIRYRRGGAGTGATVLVLLSEAGSLRDELLESLSGHFRSLVPELSPTEPNVATWLTQFLEGLGAATVSVVASGSFCIPALELALRGGDQIVRVVVIADGRCGEEVSEGALHAASRSLAMPLYIVNHDASPQDVVSLLR